MASLINLKLTFLETSGARLGPEDIKAALPVAGLLLRPGVHPASAGLSPPSTPLRTCFGKLRAGPSPEGQALHSHFSNVNSGLSSSTMCNLGLGYHQLCTLLVRVQG